MIIVALIFVSRNINRIHYEVKTYGYQPLKMTYYKIDPAYFVTSEKIKILIRQYNECEVNIKNCEKNKKLKVKKIFGKYVVYTNND
jgi:hypothetical protein